jgi:hypothetical protein
MPKGKPKIRKLRATKGAERATGEAKPILTMHTQYAIDRFGAYVQNWMRVGQRQAIKRGLPLLIKLRTNVRDTQGKESPDYKLLSEAIERYVALYKLTKAAGRIPKFDPDIERKKYG